MRNALRSTVLDGFRAAKSSSSAEGAESAAGTRASVAATGVARLSHRAPSGPSSKLSQKVASQTKAASVFAGASDSASMGAEASCAPASLDVAPSENPDVLTRREHPAQAATATTKNEPSARDDATFQR